MKRLILAACLAATPAAGHSKWADGEDVAPDVQAICCGKADAHRLDPGDIHITPKGYMIDGLNITIPIERALPSPDGRYWIFFSGQPRPDMTWYCFFAPLNGA